jgi:hypothetical protein
VKYIDFDRKPFQMSNENLDSATELVYKELKNGKKFTMLDLINFLDEHNYHEAIARYLFWDMSEKGTAKINNRWQIEENK